MSTVWCPKDKNRKIFEICTKKCPKDYKERLRIVEDCLECIFKPADERRVQVFKEKRVGKVRSRTVRQIR